MIFNYKPEKPIERWEKNKISKTISVKIMVVIIFISFIAMIFLGILSTTNKNISFFLIIMYFFYTIPMFFILFITSILEIIYKEKNT